MFGSPDPYPDRRYFECRDCLRRVTATAYLAACPDCGGGMRNLVVSHLNGAATC